MEIIDITGPIYEGMWNFGFPHGKFRIIELDFEFLGQKYYHEGFEGLVGSTGTYMETDSVLFGYKSGTTIDKVPLSKLINLDTYVLQIPLNNLQSCHDRKYVSLEDIKKAEQEVIPKETGIIVSTGYGKNWDRKDFIEKSPYFKKEALFYLISKNPILVASDFPSWDNKVKPENNLIKLFSSGTLVLPNCVNLEKIKKYRVKLIALPLKIKDVCSCPVRAAVIVE